MPTLDRDADVFVLDLGDGENRFDPDAVASLNRLLDEVVAAAAPRALVLTASGKIWSNGLDLDSVGAHLDESGAFLDSVHALLARVLTLPVPCVAALQGHAFAAGAMLALATDVRVMRADRGFFCLPEFDIHIPFTAGMAALIQARLTPQAAHEAMTTGRRYGGSDALAAGVVDAAVPLDDVVPAALQRARALADKQGPDTGRHQGADVRAGARRAGAAGAELRLSGSQAARSAALRDGDVPARSPAAAAPASRRTAAPRRRPEQRARDLATSRAGRGPGERAEDARAEHLADGAGSVVARLGCRLVRDVG